MSQSDGEPAWQGKTYEALKDKKTLDRNKQGRSLRIRVLVLILGIAKNV
jgi:hypothetical protein